MLLKLLQVRRLNVRLVRVGCSIIEEAGWDVMFGNSSLEDGD